MFSYHTLILTPWMAPHRVVSWERAMNMLVKGRIRVVDEYDDTLCRIREDRLRDFKPIAEAYRRRPGDGLGDIVVHVPSVVTLTSLTVTHKRGVKFSRVNVFVRDGFKCQYCGKRYTMRELNYDHVVPRRLGGKKAWENIVTSCYPCNDRKAGRTPEQAGMKLLKVPVRPKVLPLTIPTPGFVGVPESWKFYFHDLDMAVAVA